MNNPLVSIIMSTYNRGALLRESIQSVLDQTYRHWELIIVDDGSTDNTRDVIDGFRDERIVYVAETHSGFLGKVKNRGLRQARGELVAFHDSDDLWRTDKLEFQVRLLNQYPKAHFVLSNGNQFGALATTTPDYERLFVGNLFLPVIDRHQFCFYCPSFIFKKEVVSEIGLLDESVAFMRELHFFLRMAVKFDGIFTNERLISVRKHEGNFSHTFLVNAYLNELAMLNEFHQQGALDDAQLKRLSADCYYRIGLYHLRRREYHQAATNFRQYVLRRPLDPKGILRSIESSARQLLLHKTTAAPGTRG